MEYIAGEKVTTLSPLGAARHRRRGARRGALPRLPQADSRRRLLPRRPAPRERLPAPTTAASRSSTSAWSGASRPRMQEHLLKLAHRRQRGARRRSRRRASRRSATAPDEFDERSSSAAGRRARRRSSRHAQPSSELQLGRVVLDVARARGRVGPRAPARAHDARQDAPQPRPGRPDPRPGVRSQRVHPPERRGAPHATHAPGARSPGQPRRLAPRSQGVRREASRAASTRSSTLVSTNSLRIEVDAIDESALIAGSRRSRTGSRSGSSSRRSSSARRCSCASTRPSGSSAIPASR